MNLYFYSKGSTAVPSLRTSEGRLTTNYNALQAIRDRDIARDMNASMIQKPDCYIISSVQVRDEYREGVMNALRGSFGICQMSGVALELIDSDVRIGPDVLHEATGMMSPQVAADVLQQREKDLEPLMAAAKDTPLYSMPNLASKETRDSFAICYMRAPHNHPNLQYAIDEMGNTRLDTAASVTKFIKHYDETYEAIRAESPDAGPNQCATEAAAATALHFQQTQSGRDLALQNIYARMARDYNEVLPQAIEADKQLRDDTITVASQQVTKHLRNNGQYIDANTELNFRHQVRQTVANETWKMDGTPAANTQTVIKEVAQQFATAARDAHDDKTKFCFANIADNAEQDAADIANQAADGRDEAVISDDDAR